MQYRSVYNPHPIDERETEYRRRLYLRRARNQAVQPEIAAYLARVPTSWNGKSYGPKKNTS